MQQNAAAAEQMSATAAQLSGQSGRLVKSVGFFRLGGAQAPSQPHSFEAAPPPPPAPRRAPPPPQADVAGFEPIMSAGESDMEMEF